MIILCSGNALDSINVPVHVGTRSG